MISNSDIARALGFKIVEATPNPRASIGVLRPSSNKEEYVNYLANANDAMPIIAENKIAWTPMPEGQYRANTTTGKYMAVLDNSPIEASLKLIVAVHASKKTLHAKAA